MSEGPVPILIVHTGDGCEQYHADDMASFQTDMHLHCDRHQFVWVSKGSRTFQCDDVVFKVGEGCTLFIPAGLAHRGLPVTASCSFRTAYVPADTDGTPLTSILRRPSADFQSLFAEASLLMTLLPEPAGQGKIAARGDTPADQPIRRAQHYLDRHYCRAISLDRLSSIAGIGKYELVRRFRRRVGLSPHAYQLQLRIDRAKILLRQAEPMEIAYQLGFADQSHFGRHFKRVTGVSPGHYRQGKAAWQK